jgi:hypothetical protein
MNNYYYININIKIQDYLYFNTAASRLLAMALPSPLARYPSRPPPIPRQPSPEALFSVLSDPLAMIVSGLPHLAQTVRDVVQK